MACNTKIKSVRDRHAFLLRTGHCFSCLKPQNHARHCKSSKKCKYYCENIINLFVKDQHFQVLQNNRLPLSLQNPLLKLLQTACIVASDDTSDGSVNFQILFNTDSQWSYVTGFWKTNQIVTLSTYSILLAQLITTHIHYPFTVPLPSLTDWSAFIE